MADRRVQSDPAPARKPPAHDLLISECCDPIVQHPVIFRMKDPFCLTVDLPEGFKSLRQRIPKTRRYISECQESPEGYAIQHFIISSFPADDHDHFRVIPLGSQYFAISAASPWCSVKRPGTPGCPSPADVPVVSRSGILFRHRHWDLR